jgi:hypothetical protein
MLTLWLRRLSTTFGKSGLREHTLDAEHDCLTFEDISSAVCEEMLLTPAQLDHAAGCAVCTATVEIARRGRVAAMRAQTQHGAHAQRATVDHLTQLVGGLLSDREASDTRAAIAGCPVCEARLEVLEVDFASWRDRLNRDRPPKTRAALWWLAPVAALAAAAGLWMSVRPAADPVRTASVEPAAPATRGGAKVTVPLLLDGSLYRPQGERWVPVSELLPAEPTTPCAVGDMVLLDVDVSRPPGSPTLHEAVWYRPPAGPPRRIALPEAARLAADLRRGGSEAGRPGFAFPVEGPPGPHAFHVTFSDAQPPSTGVAEWLDAASQPGAEGVRSRALGCVLGGPGSP